MTRDEEGLSLLRMSIDAEAIYRRFSLDLGRWPTVTELLLVLADELGAAAIALASVFEFESLDSAIEATNNSKTIRISRPPQGLLQAYIQRAVSVERQISHQAARVAREATGALKNLATSLVERSQEALGQLRLFEPQFDEAARIPSPPRGHAGAVEFQTIRAVPAPVRTTEGADFRVWFGTNRKPIKGPGRLTFSKDYDADLHLGYCTVHVPEGHRIGSIGRSPWNRIFSWNRDLLRITSVASLQSIDFWDEMRAWIEALDEPDRHAVVYIHGYNVSFDQAAMYSAQIGYDLRIGCMAFFSWPSKASLKAYPADEATIAASEHHLARFLEDLVGRTGAKSVHVIAHSLGNRGLLRALQRAAGRLSQSLGQVIMAAPDVDRRFFKANAPSCRALVEGVTLYVSSADRAIELSARFHAAPRIGLLPPVTVIPGVETVDVSGIDLSFLGHGYVNTARPVLVDMHALIRHGQEANERFGLERVRTEDGEAYWRMRN